VSTYPDHILRVGTEHLAELKRKAAEFEQQLWDAHESLEQEFDQDASHPEAPVDGSVPEVPADGFGPDAPADLFGPEVPVDGYGQDVAEDGQQQSFRWTAEVEAGRVVNGQTQLDLARSPSDLAADPANRARSPEERTARLVDHGRRPPKPTHRARKIILIGVAVAIGAALLTAMVVYLFRPGPSWPASVATVERQIAIACRNPDVRSEPSQVNFACGKSTRQILWVFSLMTSGNNPDFASIRTGRQGLEPIKPSVGGQIAWSLNLHHPYNPANPIDSLQVAARAINNIIGGATMTAANGKPIVISGLESVPANCARYTGSGAVTSRAGFPALCAKPIASPAGQGYLVADVFRKWVVGARPSAAKDAAVLFQHPNDPGDPQVVAILNSLTRAKAG
jgi:hypothetical protein